MIEIREPLPLIVLIIDAGADDAFHVEDDVGLLVIEQVNQMPFRSRSAIGRFCML